MSLQNLMLDLLFKPMFSCLVDMSSSYCHPYFLLPSDSVFFTSSMTLHSQFPSQLFPCPPYSLQTSLSASPHLPVPFLSHILFYFELSTHPPTHPSPHNVPTPVPRFPACVSMPLLSILPLLRTLHASPYGISEEI